MKSKILSLALALSMCVAMLCGMTMTANAYVAGDINAQATTEVIVEENAAAAIVEDNTPLTPDGNGQLVDDSNSKNKEFITVQTKNGNYFYLILDKDRDGNNAYMLSQIDEADLAEFIEKEESEEETPVISTPVIEDEPVIDEPQEEKPTVTQSNNNTVTLLLLAAVAGGAAYYFKVYKPKRDHSQQSSRIENMDFEDEPDINEDDSSYQNTSYFVEDDLTDDE